ncbi:MAG: hypothetical protein ACI35S_06900 [Anaeroplasma sp.]
MENTNVEKIEKEPKTPKQKVIFGLKIAGNVLFYVVIILLFLFSLMNINSGGKGGVPNIFGKGFLSVQTNSMKRSEDLEILPEWNDNKIGGFEAGDLLNINIFNKKDVSSLKVGDVIAFYDDGLKAINSHRIVYVSEDGTFVYTQGDIYAQVPAHRFILNPQTEADYSHNYIIEATKFNVENNCEGRYLEQVNVEQIKGVVTSVSKGTGKVLDNIQKNWLFYFVIPVFILLVFEIFMVIKNVMDLKGEKQKALLASDKDAMMAELEAEKEKMRQELLAELKAQQLAEINEAKSDNDVQKAEEANVEEQTDTTNKETTAEDKE